MNTEKSGVRMPIGLRARTLDFYVAFLVFFFGLSGIIDPTWPERFGNGLIYWVVLIEDIYLMISAIVIMFSLIIREGNKCKLKVLVPSIIGEMFGWLFISAASLVIVITSYWIPPSAVIQGENSVLTFLWILVWSGLCVSSFFRYIDLKKYYGIHK